MTTIVPVPQMRIYQWWVMLTLALLSSQAQAQDEEVIEKRIANINRTNEAKQRKAFVRTESFTVKNDTTQITGTAVAVGIYFARDEKFSMGPRFHQSYASDTGWSTLYTALNFDFTYALTGSLLQRTQVTELNGWDVLRYNQYNSGGWRTRLSIDQYYYNLSSGAIPMSGFGIEGSYEFPSNIGFSVELGAGVDRITNPRASLTPIRFYAAFQDSF